MAVKVRERGGKWWVFIDWQGKRKARCIGSKKAAFAVKERLEAALTLGQLNLDEKRQPFDAYFQKWLDGYVRAHCKASTYDTYAKAYRTYLEPAFGGRDLSQITREDVRSLVYGLLGKGKSRNYVQSILVPLSEALGHAVEDKLTQENPARNIFRRAKIEVQPRRSDSYTRDELSRLLATCREHYAAHYPFVLTLARTGLRIGEASALQWGDIDFAGRFLTVQRNYHEGRLTTTKPGKSRRVDMSRQLTEVLRDLFVQRKEETLRRGWPEVPPWLFVSREGGLLDPSSFRRRVWVKILATAGLRRVRVHDLRHTFASLLIQQGAPLAYVKEQLGHSSIRITVDVYGHLVPGGHREEVDKLDDPPAIIPKPRATKAG